VNDGNRAPKGRETVNPINDSEDNRMNGFKFFALAAVVAICFAAVAPDTQAQVEVGIGVAPVCPYGYYDVAPYDCAPYGYYGPEWFAGGVFIGAGPWFHGPASMDTLITASILSMAITALCPIGATTLNLEGVSTKSNTSRETR
jgi:hypothetical protein